LLAPSGVAPMLPEQARFANLLTLPEGVDIAKAINEAMKAIETENEDVKDVLPRTYNRLDKELLVSLSKNFTAVLMDIEGDAFGKDLRISPRQVRDVRRPKRR
jgi:type I restriction enzyme M protein